MPQHRQTGIAIGGALSPLHPVADHHPGCLNQLDSFRIGALERRGLDGVGFADRALNGPGVTAIPGGQQHARALLGFNCGLHSLTYREGIKKNEPESSFLIKIKIARAGVRFLKKN